MLEKPASLSLDSHCVLLVSTSSVTLHVMVTVLLLGTLGSSVSVLKPLLSPLQTQQKRKLSVSCLPQDLAPIAPIQMTARHLLGDSWPPFCSSPGDLWMGYSVSVTHRVHGWDQPRLAEPQGASLSSSPVVRVTTVCV